MKVKVTMRGVYGYPVGSIIEIDGSSMPRWLVGKAVQVKGDSGKTLVVNPAPAAEDAVMSKDDLVVKATMLGIDVDARWGTRRLLKEIAAAEAGE